MPGWVVSRRAFCWLGLNAAVTGLIACSQGGEPTATFAPTILAPTPTASPARPTETPPAPTVTTVVVATATRIAAASAAATSTATVLRTCTPTRSVSSATDSPIGMPPERASVGQGHLLSGTIRSARDCAPVVGASLFFWLARPDGQYAPTHEALVNTDGRGSYRFESNYPGKYEGTPPHIHVFISAPGHKGIEQNYQPPANQTAGTFDVVLEPE